MKKMMDLNSDMGEGFGPWTLGDGADEAIMSQISSANIATGFHAGDPNIMRQMVSLAKQHEVGIGAHPGFRDLAGFGRRDMKASSSELLNDIIYQTGALREFAHWEGLRLQHVKPHGALYMRAARDEELSIALIKALQEIDPSLYLYCMEASVTYKIAKTMGHPVVREFYGDRDYDKTGSIVFTRQVGQLDPKAVAARALRACTDGVVRTVEGEDIDIDFDSICIHSDTPGALALIKATKTALTSNGIQIASLSKVVPR
jgi:UPF0271 protein